MAIMRRSSCACKEIERAAAANQSTSASWRPVIPVNYVDDRECPWQPAPCRDVNLVLGSTRGVQA